MIKKIILSLILISLASIIFAQTKDDFIKTEYKQKSVMKALALSSLFPGAGQFYANPKSITTYIFPVLEIGLIYGYHKYLKDGEDIEKKYERYATEEVIGYYDSDSPIIAGVNASEGEFYREGDPIHRYERWRQYVAQENFLENSGDPSHFSTFFTLDDENTQHFYEDIGKYNKYIFGWHDWFTIYGEYIDNFSDYNFHWIFQEDISGGGNKWQGNTAYSDTISYYVQDKEKYDSNNGMYSSMREKYDIMRADAEDQFAKSRKFFYGIMFNHILAALDAVRVTKKANISALSQNKIKFNVSPVFTQSGVYPYLSLSKRFY